MTVNKAILIGNLGRDPELRRTASQMSVCSFSLATTDRRKDQSGAWVENTEWHNIVVFGSVAENCAKFLKKGRKAYIEGRITNRKWQDKEGKERSTTEIVASTVQFLSPKEEGGYAEPSFSKGSDSFDEPAFSEKQDFGGPVSFDDDDIPF